MCLDVCVCALHGFKFGDAVCSGSCGLVVFHVVSAYLYLYGPGTFWHHSGYAGEYAKHACEPMLPGSSLRAEHKNYKKTLTLATGGLFMLNTGLRFDA